MSKPLLRKFSFLSLIFALNFSLCFPQANGVKDNTKLTEVLAVMDSVYTKVNKYYVEDVELEKLMRRGIDAMFLSLDPFTYFMSKEEAEEFQMSLSGKFGGAGMVIRDVDQEVVIERVFRDRPADKAGLRPADAIIEIEGVPTKGKSIYQVFPVLRGTPGSVLNLKIKRTGSASPIAMKIVREEIKVGAIPYYGILNSVGYIKLTHYSENCSEEVLKAFHELKSRQALHGIVLDLRDNTGGYFREAIKIANIFINQGVHLVSIRNRSEDSLYKAPNSAIDANIPLVILTNNNTASAAEVLCGAIQDLDRGLIIGQKTFGKGLVGVPYNMGGGTKAVITTSYYYTPSGRCIQSRNYPGMEKSVVRPQDIKKNFTTKNGRTIHDREGIVPDIAIETKGPAPITACLIDSNFIFKWSSQYKQAHPSIPDPSKFRLTDEEYNQFLASFQGKGCQYTTDTELKIREVEEKARKEGYLNSIQSELHQLDIKLRDTKKEDLKKYKSQIKGILEEEIASRYFYEEGRLQSRLKDDPALKKAIELLHQQVEFKSLLGYR